MLLRDQKAADRFERAIADAFNVVELVHAGKRPVRLSIGDDALGEHFANAGQRVQLVHFGRVDVEKISAVLDGGILHGGNGRKALLMAERPGVRPAKEQKKRRQRGGEHPAPGTIHGSSSPTRVLRKTTFFHSITAADAGQAPPRGLYREKSL